MCFEKPLLSWLLETHVASRYEGAVPPQKLDHRLVSSGMVLNYDQRR